MTGADSGPRIWSAGVIAGNVSVSDSGVTDTANDVHVSDVGGATSFVTVGATSTTGCGVELQDAMDKRRIMMKVAIMDDFINWFIVVSLPEAAQRTSSMRWY